MSGTLPALFVSHGAPTLALDRSRGATLTRWGQALPRPSAVLVVSAHWDASPARLGTVRRRPILHDFVGFPAELDRLGYDAPPAPELATRVRALLGPTLYDEPERPWDHGVWVPLLHLFPAADVPVLQLSLPGRATLPELFALGRALAPLRDEGVLVVGSGGAVHNLGRLEWTGTSPPPAWAVEFEGWLRDVLLRGDVDALLDAEARAPAMAWAHPTLEHFQPLLVASGAAWTTGTQVTFPSVGWDYGSLSYLGVQFGG